MAIDEPKGWLSALAGLLLIALGGIPILNSWNILPFGIPGFMTTLLAQLFPFVLAVGALWLVIDSLMEDDALRVISLIIGLVVLAAGVLTILNKFAVIGFTVPFLTPFVYSLLFVVLGLFLIIAAFAMW